MPTTKPVTKADVLAAALVRWPDQNPAVFQFENGHWYVQRTVRVRHENHLCCTQAPTLDELLAKIEETP